MSYRLSPLTLDTTGGRSEGRRLLVAALSRLTGKEIAKRIEASRAAVSQWASGARTPCARARLALQAHLGIDAATWDEARPMFTPVNRSEDTISEEAGDELAQKPPTAA